MGEVRVLRPPSALDRVWARSDANFFVDHPDRKAHIRKCYQGECAGEFWTLGEHDKDRRCVILTRVDVAGMPIPNGQILKIPMLLFSDETIEDRDDILLPEIRRIMNEQAGRT